MPNTDEIMNNLFSLWNECLKKNLCSHLPIAEKLTYIFKFLRTPLSCKAIFLHITTTLASFSLYRRNEESAIFAVIQWPKFTPAAFCKCEVKHIQWKIISGQSKTYSCWSECH